MALLTLATLLQSCVIRELFRYQNRCILTNEILMFNIKKELRTESFQSFLKSL